MNQNIQITNLTKGIINLVGKYQILPGKSIILGVLEYNPILSKINLQKNLGWLDWKFIPVNYSKQEVPTVEEKFSTVNEPAQEVVVKPTVNEVEVSTSTAEDKNFDKHPASPLIAKKWKKMLKQEGEPKTDDSKRTV